MNNYNPNIHHRRSIRLQGYDYSQEGLYFITICCENRELRFGKIENDEMILNEFGSIAYKEWAKLPERFPNFDLDVFQIMPNHIHGIIALKDVGAGFTPAQNNATDKPVGAGFTPAQNNATDKTVGAGFTPAQNENGQNDFRQPETITGQPETITGQPETITGQPQGLPLPHDDDNNIGAGVNPAPTKNATVGDIVGAYKSLVTNACIDICNSKNIRLGKLWQRNYHEHIIRNEQSYQTISEYIINNPRNWKDDKFNNQ